MPNGPRDLYFGDMVVALMTPSLSLQTAKQAHCHYSSAVEQAGLLVLREVAYDHHAELAAASAQFV